MIAAFEHIVKRPMTKEEKVNLSLSWEGRPINDVLEERGIGGFYEPIFIGTPEEIEAQKEAKLAENQEKSELWFDRVGKVMGLTEDDFREMRPQVDYWQRFYVDAKAQGMSDEAILANITDPQRFGRARMAAVFGVDALEEFDWNKDFNEQELESLAQGAEWDGGQLSLIAQLSGMPAPTYEQVKAYVLGGGQRLTKTMQTALAEAGYPMPPQAPSISNRKPYPGYDVLADAERGNLAVDAGIENYFGRPGGSRIPSGLAPTSWLDRARRSSPQE